METVKGKILDTLFTEEKSTEFAQQILSKLQKEIKDKIADEFYKETEGWLFEIYCNAKNKIDQQLMNEIADAFIKDTSSYKYTSLRRKIFEENKNTILQSLTDEAIETSLQSILWDNFSNEVFGWKWKAGITKFIIDNWNELKDDETINNGLLKIIETQKSQIENMRKRIDGFISENEDL